MGTNLFHFKNILQKCKINETLIRHIESASDSPLKRAFEADLLQPNDINHSHCVLRNCLKLLLNSKFNITNDDYLLLFYSSLLHDFSKSESSDVKNDINKLKFSYISEAEDSIADEIRKCHGLVFDHGVLSAHFIRWKHNTRKIKLYGLEGDVIRRLWNIISFHSSGTMHPCFLPEGKMQIKELFLCLVFWLADIADGTCERALADRIVNETTQSSKSKGRLGVERVEINENAIIWRISEESRPLKQAVFMSNNELSKYRLLLQAFNLPSRIIYLKKHQKIKKENSYLEYNDIISANLCLDISQKDAPLVLSSDTLSELYTKIVDAFHQKTVKDEPTYTKYFGPVVLEVKNASIDEGKIIVRNEQGKNFEDLKEYANSWIDKGEKADKYFYFRYTHGQRIWRHSYPVASTDLENDCTPQDWKTFINQFDYLVKLLKKEQKNARRGYVVIVNPIIDHPNSKFYQEAPMAPALLAIQFVLEKDNRLSGFALLRAQELSTFFIVNYLEIKELLNKLINRLKEQITNIKIGRIVMMSAIAYFDPNTPLLEKPELCKLPNGNIRDYGKDIDKYDVRRKFIDLLTEFGENVYCKIETKWCDLFKENINEEGIPGIIDIKRGIENLKRKLNEVNTILNEKGYSTRNPDIQNAKKEAVNKFIKVLREAFNGRI